MKKPYFLTIFAVFLMVFALNSGAVIVIKVKNKQALIDLQGLKTKPGAYFSVIDVYGQKQGVVKLKKVAHTKAIGHLEHGTMASDWSLKPISTKTALSIKNKAKQESLRQARIQREKIKRRLAYKKAKRRQKMLAQRKRELRRKIASYEEQDILIDLEPENNNSPSQEILSYDSSYDFNSDRSSNITRFNNSASQPATSPQKSVMNLSRLRMGIAPLAEYGLVRMTPEKKTPPYWMKGMGYGGLFFVDFFVNNFLKAEGSIGGKLFSVKADAKDCGDNDCLLDMIYILGGLNLKLNLLKFSQHNLFLVGGGTLMWPFCRENTVLEENACSPPQGTMGGGLELDFNFGKLSIPVTLRGDVMLPFTKTVKMFIPGARLGIAYNF